MIKYTNNDEPACLVLFIGQQEVSSIVIDCRYQLIVIPISISIDYPRGLPVHV